jgi:hypothetical protein
MRDVRRGAVGAWLAGLAAAQLIACQVLYVAEQRLGL